MANHIDIYYPTPVSRRPTLTEILIRNNQNWRNSKWLKHCPKSDVINDRQKSTWALTTNSLSSTTSGFTSLKNSQISISKNSTKNWNKRYHDLNKYYEPNVEYSLNGAVLAPPNRNPFV